jgi:hypothetical protein
LIADYVSIDAQCYSGANLNAMVEAHRAHFV